MYTVDELEDKLIDLSFAEDIGDGDHTTLCCIPEDAMGKSHLLIKEDGILAGVEVAKKVFARFDDTMNVEVLIQDGAHVKQAVKIGGGMNHRIGLFDMILLKDNHVDFAGGITNAIDRCHKYLEEKGLKLKIEIEVRNFDELQQVIDHGGVDRIMLDNFSVADTRKAVEIIAGRFETESSGGITFDTIRQYAECGVDFISVGALTHSVKGLDMSFKAC